MSNVPHAAPASTPNPIAEPAGDNSHRRALVQIHPVDLHRDLVALVGTRWTLGRDSACDLAIPDPSVSRRHAEIRLTEQGAVLSDLNSTNGVAVNGVRVKSHPLVNGDSVQVGTFVFRYLEATENLESLYEAAVYAMLTRDGLTRVFNRRYLIETLYREVERCRRHARPLAVAVAGIDQINEVADRYGTLIADQVIRQLAKRLENVLRADDLLARTELDTFSLVMVEAELEQVIEVAERCRVAVSCEPIATSVGPVAVTISLGVVAPAARDLGSGEELICEAKSRLAEAGRAGGNRTVC